MKIRLALVLMLVNFISACGGIPLHSIPKLIRLQSDLLVADPAEFMLAIQTDERMTPPPDSPPKLILSIKPAESGAFQAIDKQLPMHFSIATSNKLGLPTPSAKRKWLIYSLTGESQKQLTAIQTYFKNLQQQKLGGSLSVGIAQEGVAVKEPAFADSEWQSWLRLSQQDGFFELWSGTIADLLKQAKANEDANNSTQ